MRRTMCWTDNLRPCKVAFPCRMGDTVAVYDAVWEVVGLCWGENGISLMIRDGLQQMVVTWEEVARDGRQQDQGDA